MVLEFKNYYFLLLTNITNKSIILSFSLQLYISIFICLIVCVTGLFFSKTLKITLAKVNKGNLLEGYVKEKAKEPALNLGRNQGVPRNKETKVLGVC